MQTRTLPRNAGFTLIEVLTAVGVMGILMVMAAPNFRDIAPGFRTRGAALAVAGDINQARMSAVKEGRVYEYFPISGGYRIRRDDGAGGREVLKEVVIGTQFPYVSLGAPGGLDPYGIAVGPASPAATIVFQSDGTVQNAASVYLQASTTIGMVQRAVTLSAAGRVRVWRYSGGTWN